MAIKFIDNWIEKGKAEGEALTRADDILRILAARDLQPKRAQRELIEDCKDLAKLNTWFGRSLVVTDVDDLFEDDEE